MAGLLRCMSPKLAHPSRGNCREGRPVTARKRTLSRSPSSKTPKTDPAQVEDVDSCNDGRFTALAWFRRGVNTRIDR
jgi:hypothetical protein